MLTREKEEEKEEDKEEDKKEEDKKEDRSHGLSVCPFDVLSPHCSTLGPLCAVNCTMCTTHYTLCTVLSPAGTTLHFKLYYTIHPILYSSVLCTRLQTIHFTMHT